jgi:hypothetical protein
MLVPSLASIGNAYLSANGIFAVLYPFEASKRKRAVLGKA